MFKILTSLGAQANTCIGAVRLCCLFAALCGAFRTGILGNGACISVIWRAHGGGLINGTGSMNILHRIRFTTDGIMILIHIELSLLGKYDQSLTSVVQGLEAFATVRKVSILSWLIWMRRDCLVSITSFT